VKGYFIQEKLQFISMAAGQIFNSKHIHKGKIMNTIIIGGTGFLGYYAGRELLGRGHAVTALGLAGEIKDEAYLRQVQVILQNIETAKDDELLAHFRGKEALVYSTGADDRLTPKRPAYPFFYHHNVEVTTRVLNLAKRAGIKRVVVLGSYFVHFARIWPEMKLSEHHPYIRSRIEQEKACFELATDGFDVMFIELPYIFGGMAGRKPLWVPLVNMARSGTVYFCTGGTNCVSVRSVSEAIAGAVERGQSGQAYLVGDENLTWEQMFQGFGRGLGRPVKVVSLPKVALQMVMFFFHVSDWLQGRERGLDPLSFTHLQSANTFFDAQVSQQALGYSRGSLEQAFKDTVEACQ
jgi:nucleoside-diphosphate-sugar epimerase